jgi:hypothetical protein
MGSAQATTSRIVGIGRSGVARVAALRPLEPATLGLTQESRMTAREAVERGRGAVGGLLGGDVDAVVNRLGLAKKSELHAVRQQLQRLERRLGEVRGER